MTRLRSIYICGPMRGRPDNNVPAFNRAADRFRALGWMVENPVDISATVVAQYGEEPAPGEFLRHDAKAIAGCDAIALLPEWEHSTGARCEVGLALTIGLDFYDAGTCTRMAPPELVVIRGGYERPPGPVDTLDTLRAEINAWQRDTFIHRTPHSIATHLLREATELHQRPDALDEAADVFMLLVGLTDGRDLVGAVREKLERNRRRSWGKPDADGVVEHIAEGAA